MCRHSTHELGGDIRALAVKNPWPADPDVTHRFEAVSVDGELAEIRVQTSKGGFRLQTTMLHLVHVNHKWLVKSGSFRLGDRWLKHLKSEQRNQNETLFQDLKQAIEQPNPNEQPSPIESPTSAIH